MDNFNFSAARVSDPSVLTVSGWKVAYTARTSRAGLITLTVAMMSPDDGSLVRLVLPPLRRTPGTRARTFTAYTGKRTIRHCIAPATVESVETPVPGTYFDVRTPARVKASHSIVPSAVYDSLKAYVTFAAIDALYVIRHGEGA